MNATAFVRDTFGLDHPSLQLGAKRLTRTVLVYKECVCGFDIESKAISTRDFKLFLAIPFRICHFSFLCSFPFPFPHFDPP